MTTPGNLLMPFATFTLIDERESRRACDEWGHYLGPCERPFRLQHFGLFRDRELVSVAVSASTVGATCAGYDRRRVVELARLVSHPEHRWATRVCLRLWRELGARQWPLWPCEAAVSYSDATRHAGDVYRFDGWTRAADVRGSGGGGTWSGEKVRTPKTIWVYRLTEAA